MQNLAGRRPQQAAPPRAAVWECRMKKLLCLLLGALFVAGLTVGCTQTDRPNDNPMLAQRGFALTLR